jgi:PKD repeat protein
MIPARLLTGGSGRRRATGFIAVIALSFSGLVAMSAAPAFADSGAVPVALHGAASLGSETASASSGALSGSITASASMTWDQTAAVGVSWDHDNVRQGRNLNPTDTYTRTLPGQMSITYSVSGSVGIDTGSAFGVLSFGFGPDSLTATGSCDLKAGGPNYLCHLESNSVGIVDPSIFAVGFPYLDGKMVADVTVTPAELDTLRTASAAGQTLGTHSLALAESPVTDPLQVGCRTGTGDHLSYAFGDFSSTPGLHIESGVQLEVGAILPNPVTFTPGFHQAFYTGTIPVATTDLGITMSGPGGSVDMGAIQANNIAPTLGAVSAPDGVEGTPIQFSTSATGPCAAGATYSWDFGDGSSPGHTESPTHKYADNGVYTGQVVVTDSTGLTDTTDFTVHVANVAPNVTVIPGAPVTVPWGKPLTLQAQAVDPGSADQSTLTYDWTFGDGDSITNGGPTATHSWASAGDRTPTVNVCDKDGGCTLKTFTVHVRTHATTLAYSGPQAADFSSTSTLTADLVDEFGSPVNNAPVVFSVDGLSVGTAMTNAAGHASLAYVDTRTAGNHTVSASYAGSPLYDASGTGNLPFVVSPMASKITYTGGLSGAPNKPTTLSATVVDALGRPLGGYVVTFVLGGQSTTATTNSSGVATKQLVLNQKPGFYPLTASWTGDPGKYLGASTSAQFSLNKK